MADDRYEDTHQSGKIKPEARLFRQKLVLRESGRVEKAARIKLAARELFHEVEYEATTIQAVAERARIGKRTLFSYASVKQDLLIIVFMDELMEVARRWDAQRSADLVDRLCRLYGSMLEHHHKTASLSRHLVREIDYIKSPEMRANIAPLIRFILEIAVSFIAREQLRSAFYPDVNAGIVAEIVSRFIITS